MDHSTHVSEIVARPISWWDKLVLYFSEADFMPHGHCYLWKPGLVYTHVIADFLIGLAYVAISLTLYGLVKKINLRFNRVVLCFGTFIAACGWTHFNEIWNLWHSDYWYSGMVKVITAVASVGTGVYLWKLRNPIIAVAEAAKLSEQRRLDLEVLTKNLENRVHERTAELQESESRFRQLADSMTQLAWMARPDGHFVWYNQRWYVYTGMGLTEVGDWGWEKFHHPDHVSLVTSFVQEAWNRSEAWELTFPLKSKDAEWRWFLTRAAPLTNSKGEITQWFGTSTDIDDQIKIEEKLKESLKSRDEFLSIASHELKTPLTSLSLLTQTIQRSISKGDPEAYSKDKMNKLLDQNEKNVARLNRLVEDMLDIARIRTGRLKIEKDWVDVYSIISDVAEKLAPNFQKLNVDLKTSQSEQIFASVDKMRIDQVITNLLANALKYGKGKPVEVNFFKKGNAIRIHVVDQGIGISSENQERIFNRFERAISANEVSGLGLGLFISREIVKAHEGRIWVESELGNGATFIVELPIHTLHT